MVPFVHQITTYNFNSLFNLFFTLQPPKWSTSSPLSLSSSPLLLQPLLLLSLLKLVMIPAAWTTFLETLWPTYVSCPARLQLDPNYWHLKGQRSCRVHQLPRQPRWPSLCCWCLWPVLLQAWKHSDHWSCCWTQQWPNLFFSLVSLLVKIDFVFWGLLLISISAVMLLEVLVLSWSKYSSKYTNCCLLTILSRCTRADGKVRGQNPAWGNGHLMVDIRNVPQ